MTDDAAQVACHQMVRDLPENFQNRAGTAHPDRRTVYRPLQVLIPDATSEQVFSKWEAMFLCTILNSTYMNQGREQRIYWATRNELVFQFDEATYENLKGRHIIEEWAHHDGFSAATLTPWTAKILGMRLQEHWVCTIERTLEYRGLHRRPQRIRIRRWDVEAGWTYAKQPERSIRLPGHTSELPLVGDPEDKTVTGKEEYLADWETWSFTKNPTKALTLTIQVGSFAHKITIQRDARLGKSGKSHAR